MVSKGWDGMGWDVDEMGCRCRWVWARWGVCKMGVGEMGGGWGVYG